MERGLSADSAQAAAPRGGAGGWLVRLALRALQSHPGSQVIITFPSNSLCMMHIVHGDKPKFGCNPVFGTPVVSASDAPMARIRRGLRSQTNSRCSRVLLLDSFRV